MSSPLRRYQPVGRNVTLVCHLLDSVALVGRLDGAEPDGFVRDPEDIEGRQRWRFWWLLRHGGSIGRKVGRFKISPAAAWARRVEARVVS